MRTIKIKDSIGSKHCKRIKEGLDTEFASPTDAPTGRLATFIGHIYYVVNAVVAQ